MKLKKFTLVEIMIVVAIIAIVAGIGVTSISANRDVAAEQSKKENVKALKVAILCYLTHNPDHTMEDIDSLEVIAPFLNQGFRQKSDYKIAGEVVSITNGVVTYVPGH